jgi:hypothetical protein
LSRTPGGRDGIDAFPPFTLITQIPRGAGSRQQKISVCQQLWRSQAAIHCKGGRNPAMDFCPGHSPVRAAPQFEDICFSTMGSHADLQICGVSFSAWKHYESGLWNILILFNESEKKVQHNPLAHESIDDEDPSPLYSIAYETTVEVLKKRLDFLGFTIDACRTIFENAKGGEIESTQASIKRFSQYRENNPNIDAYIEQESKRIELLSNSNADTWLIALREAHFTKPDIDPAQLSELSRLLTNEELLRSSRFPGSFDERVRLRFELEAAVAGQVVLNVSELVDAEYYDHSDPLSEFARDYVPASDRGALHLIVLTEGSTDKLVLEGALRIVRPELVSYISFMDFAELKIEGGASHLASLVRSFAAAGIRDRIVAVFDNDTAGCLSQALVSKCDLPKNIRVIRYPDIELARNYPSLGPSGLVSMDVNGSAAGIELYMGSDVLTGTDGSLAPIQWKGYEATLKRYQGEVIDKRKCLMRFSEKLKKAEQERENVNASEWDDLKAIVDAICAVFNLQDAEKLIEAAQSQEIW